MVLVERRGRPGRFLASRSRFPVDQQLWARWTGCCAWPVPPRWFTRRARRPDSWWRDRDTDRGGERVDPFGLKPHLVETWKLSTDPEFIAKVRDVVGAHSLFAAYDPASGSVIAQH